MDDKRVNEIFKVLANEYPDAHCELNYTSNFELLVAVILSAQCTDKRVNVVTAQLFKEYNTPLAFASLSEEELGRLIFSCGFYRNKARSIISASHDILTRFNGQVPCTMDELLSLRGVGRKTANVVLSVAFDIPAMAVDTHVKRTSQRLGLTDKNTPDSIEKDLTLLLKPELLKSAHHYLIFLGRYCCHSQNPNCASCALSALCNYYTN